MTEWLTVPQLAELTEEPPINVRKRIYRGKYSLTQQAENSGVGRGGKVWLVNINDPAIPETIRQKHLAALQPSAPDFRQSGSFIPEQGAHGLPAPSSSAIPEKFKMIALARFDLVVARKAHRRGYKEPKSRLKADEDFELAYNSGFLLPAVFDTLGRVDITTIKRWYRKLDGTTDWTRLVPEWNCKKQEPSLAPKEKELFQDCLLHPNRMSIGEATRITKTVLKKRGVDPDSLSSDRKYRRWAEWFMSKYGHIWTLMREGQKALIDKEIFSIERDISRLEVGDVLIADGHRLDFMVKHPFNGKPVRATIVGYLDWKSWDLIGYEIMVEENTQCVASALRNAIIRLGKKPRIAYQDNGKAFKAKYFTDKTDFEQCGFYGLFGRLEIVPVFAMKYRARAKVIERFWKEFIGKFERLQTSFTGASVDDKPAWTRMGETFHKAIHNGYVPTIEEVKDMVDTWIEDYLEVQPCPHVHGKTIGEVFNAGKGPGVDVAELDELMLAAEIKTIQAGCIRVFGAEYEHENLFGLHEAVYIKYSLFDLSSIKVYDREGNHLCTASRKAKVHPMAQYLGNPKDIAERNYQLNKQRALQKGTEKMVKELMAGKKDAALPWADIVEVLPRLPQKLEQIQTDAEAASNELPRIPEGAYGNSTAVSETCADPSEQPDKDARPGSFGMDGIDKFEWLEKHPDQVTQDDIAWMEDFKNTGAYRNLMELRKEGRENEFVQHDDIKHPVTAGTMHGA